MGKLIAWNSITLDGIMQAPGGADEDTRNDFRHGGWAAPYFDDMMLEMSTGGETVESVMLFGRRTYEQFHSFWPSQAGNPYSEILEKSRKYVVSRTLAEPLPWANSVLLNGDPVGLVSGVKDEEDLDVVMLGSGELLRSLLPAGLVDELTLLIHPLVLGEGFRLFPDGHRLEMELVETATNTRGVIIATYRPS
ncbi:MAG TPA: dihydrofolate reductase family protein [Acidimicrobiia bacterium]|nr:dihydrofolate reductase family protein [Acidimicrobiia bacterium]